MKEASVRIPLSDPRSKVVIERINQLETSFTDMQPSKPVAIYSVKSLASCALTPTSMRHTFSNDTEESLAAEGLTEEERRPILMQLRGDSSPSSVDPYIQRTREKQSRKHLIARQRAMFETPARENEDVPF